MARLVDDIDANLWLAGVDNITYYIYDTDDYSQESTGTLTKADVMQTAVSGLQTGNGWDKDGDGYNFRWKIDELLLPSADGVDKRYEVEIVFVLSNAAADKAFVVAAIDRKNLRSQAAPA
jgi:hypothetical protein